MVELVTLQAADGCLIDAAFWPAQGQPPPFADACITVHGATGNAYGGLQRDLAAALSGNGIATLAVNTRGHDVVARVPHVSGSPRRGGTAYENLDEAAHDFHAAAAFLRERGHARLAIAGHSLGAVKSIYVQATRPVPEAVCVVAISPPRIAWEVQDSGAMAERFRQTRALALEMIAAGREHELLYAPVPIPSHFGAGEFERKYGPDSRYDISRHFAAVPTPVLFVYGSDEVANLQQIGASEVVARAWAAANAGRAELRMVEGADHSYTRHRDAVTSLVAAWLRGRSPE